MGFGYADRLSYREDLGGSLGEPELQEPEHALLPKIQQLRQLISSSQKIVAFTGAGISKAAGVPDFRGPTGIWTLQRLGLPIPKLPIEFGAAKPTITHQALVALQTSRQLTCVVSQNVDGLHTRSGIRRDLLAELHGSCFVEKCGRCAAEAVRDFELDTVGFKRTGRRCSCGGAFRDQVLDWESPLPDEDYDRALLAARDCDLMLVLGSSLNITPACEIPSETVAAGGKLVVVNLQPTKLDKIAHLVLHAKCEDVMSQMGLLLPDYCRNDSVKVTFTQEEDFPLRSTSTGFQLRVTSPASDTHVTPVLSTVQFSIAVVNNDGEEGEPETIVVTKLPFQVRHRVQSVAGSLRVRLQLHLSSDADEELRHVHRETMFRLNAATQKDVKGESDGSSNKRRKRLHVVPQEQVFSFVTQQCTYN